MFGIPRGDQIKKGSGMPKERKKERKGGVRFER